MTGHVKTFRCPTCKGLASGMGHLCHPKEVLAPYVCEFCGAEVSTARHACGKMLDSIEYICEACGRPAPYDTLLCSPLLIEKD